MGTPLQKPKEPLAEDPLQQPQEPFAKDPPRKFQESPMEDPPQNPPQNPQVPRRKYTKFEAIVRWELMERKRMLQNKVRYDLPKCLPGPVASLTRTVAKMVEDLLDWAISKI